MDKADSISLGNELAYLIGRLREAIWEQDRVGVAALAKRVESTARKIRRENE